MKQLTHEERMKVNSKEKELCPFCKKNYKRVDSKRCYKCLRKRGKGQVSRAESLKKGRDKNG